MYVCYVVEKPRHVYSLGSLEVLSSRLVVITVGKKIHEPNTNAILFGKTQCTIPLSLSLTAQLTFEPQQIEYSIAESLNVEFCHAM